jgi:oxygen-dependent protoporphyrinogen oxidase
MTRVVIIGGGAAGLGCALSLLDTFRARGGSTSEAGLKLSVLEAREQVGGRVSSESHGGYVIETGAATILESAPGFLELSSRLGLQSALVYSDDRARRRYLWRAGRLRRLPSRPPDILTSDALSVAARLRLFAEPFVPPAPPGLPELPGKGEAGDSSEETVGAFFRRRLGQRATEELVDAAVSGIYAGDIEELSMRSALPRVWQMERQHGSLLKALRSERPTTPGSAPRLCGFRQGLGQLTQALSRTVQELGGEVRLCSPARSLSRSGAGYRIVTDDGSLDAERVILAVPPKEAARLLKPLDEPLSTLYAGIPMAPIVAITLGWPREQVPHPLDGFGFLVPRIERLRDGPRLLGALFMTSALPEFEQAPRGQVVVRAMYGGAHDPEIVRMDDGELLEQVRRDLRAALGIWTEPRFIHIQRWADAIEQYVRGHAARVADIEARLRGQEGLFAVGAALHGVSVPEVLAHAQKVGTQLAAQLPIRG